MRGITGGRQKAAASANDSQLCRALRFSHDESYADLNVFLVYMPVVSFLA